MKNTKALSTMLAALILSTTFGASVAQALDSHNQAVKVAGKAKAKKKKAAKRSVASVKKKKSKPKKQKKKRHHV